MNTEQYDLRKERFLEDTENYRHRGVTTQPLYGYEHGIKGSMTFTSTGEVVESEIPELTKSKEDAPADPLDGVNTTPGEAMCNPIRVTADRNSAEAVYRSNWGKYEAAFGAIGENVPTSFDIYCTEPLPNSDSIKSVTFSNLHGVKINEDIENIQHFNQGRIYFTEIIKDDTTVQDSMRSFDVTVVFSDNTGWTMNIHWDIATVA